MSTALAEAGAAEPSMAPAIALDVRRVAKKFGGLVAISDLTFQVPEGSVVSLIGPNGAGKTTAFNIITGFLRPTEGSVLCRGADLIRLSPPRIAALGIVRTFQRTSIFEACTVFDNVLTGLHLQGSTGVLGALLRPPSVRREEERLRAEAAKILLATGLDRRSGDLAGNLAYGEQRLLGVSIALAAAPRILLMDEPAAGLNPSETAHMMGLVRLIRDQGVTVLLVEHDMKMVMAISDTVVVLNQGRIIANGPPASIQAHPEVIAAYLGQGRKHAPR
jgi:branched-chain amino acid transport system ATP-binding protein